MIKYKEGYKYQLHDTYAIKTGIEGFSCTTDFIHLFSDGTLVIYRGYAWDGATGFPDFDWIMRPSLVHDALYQLMRLELIHIDCKVKADALFETLCEEAFAKENPDLCFKEFFANAVSSLVGEGVKLFGFRGLREERKIHIAP